MTHTDKLKALKVKEDVVLSALLTDPKFRVKAMQFLKGSDFVIPRNQEIYHAMASLARSQRSWNGANLNEMVGEVHLDHLRGIPVDIDPLEFARDIRNDGDKIHVRNLLEEFVGNMGSDSFDYDTKKSVLIQKISEPVIAHHEAWVGAGASGNFMDLLEKDPSPSIGKTGLSELDKMLEGFELSQVYSVIAPSSAGKSTLGLQVFDECMATGVSCMYLSNELLKPELMARLVARRTGIPVKRILRGAINEEDAGERIVNAIGQIDVVFRSTNSSLVDRLKDFHSALNYIRYMVTTTGVKMVFIDHLHNFYYKDYYDLERYSSLLQALAQELNICIFVLAQMSTGSQKEKMIENVIAKGTKTLDEVSRGMIVILRKVVKQDIEDMEDDPSKAQIILKKNTNGATGKFISNFDYKFYTFRDGTEASF